MIGSVKRLAGAAAVVVMVSGAAAPVLAAGDGAGGGPSGPVKMCPRGKVLDQRTGQCVDRASESLDDHSRYAYGTWLAETGRYGEAIEVLSLVEDKDDPRVLNYLGYAHRQLGRIEVGLGYYRQALAVDPDYVRAREYLGEAYVVLGRLDLASQQLDEIAARCGATCEEYRLLAEAIGEYEVRRDRRS